MSSASHCVPGKEVKCQDITSPSGNFKEQRWQCFVEIKANCRKTKAAKPKPHVIAFLLKILKQKEAK